MQTHYGLQPHGLGRARVSYLQSDVGRWTVADRRSQADKEMTRTGNRLDMIVTDDDRDLYHGKCSAARIRSAANHAGLARLTVMPAGMMSRRACFFVVIDGTFDMLHLAVRDNYGVGRCAGDRRVSRRMAMSQRSEQTVRHGR